MVTWSPSILWPLATPPAQKGAWPPSHSELISSERPEREDTTMLPFLLLACALAACAYMFHHVVVRGRQCTSAARLGGKTVIVTGEVGGTSGEDRKCFDLLTSL